MSKNNTQNSNNDSSGRGSSNDSQVSRLPGVDNSQVIRSTPIFIKENSQKPARRAKGHATAGHE